MYTTRNFNDIINYKNVIIQGNLNLSGNLNGRFPNILVSGPSTSTNRAISIFNGTTGKIIQNSSITVSSSGSLNGIKNINLSGTINNINPNTIITKTSIKNLNVWGDGSDGNVIINSNTTQTRNMYYYNLTVASGNILNTGGFYIFVKNNLTLNGNISLNGINAMEINGDYLAGPLVGSNVEGAVGYGVAGVRGLILSDGINSDRSIVFNNLNCKGGNIIVDDLTRTGGITIFNNRSSLISRTLFTIGSGLISGGASGAAYGQLGTERGSATGSGGGPIIIYSKNIFGFGYITSNGGNPLASDVHACGGSGGGIIIVRTSTYPSTITLQANGSLGIFSPLFPGFSAENGQNGVIIIDLLYEE
jgi:hypothetical protein